MSALEEKLNIFLTKKKIRKYLKKKSAFNVLKYLLKKRARMSWSNKQATRLEIHPAM